MWNVLNTIMTCSRCHIECHYFISDWHHNHYRWMMIITDCIAKLSVRFKWSAFDWGGEIKSSIRRLVECRAHSWNLWFPIGMLTFLNSMRHSMDSTVYYSMCYNCTFCRCSYFELIFQSIWIGPFYIHIALHGNKLPDTRPSL